MAMQSICAADAPRRAATFVTRESSRSPALAVTRMIWPGSSARAVFRPGSGVGAAGGGHVLELFAGDINVFLYREGGLAGRIGFAIRIPEQHLKSPVRPQGIDRFEQNGFDLIKNIGGACAVVDQVNDDGMIDGNAAKAGAAGGPVGNGAAVMPSVADAGGAWRFERWSCLPLAAPGQAR